MSSDTDKASVILIAPETNNQDGTHTYYILDPVSPEQSVDESKIELIDLTAEVTNTGKIAVLSTNSNTGAWEINLTNKTDPMDGNNANRFNSERENSAWEEFTDDDTVQKEVKNEEEDVDVEELKSESESLIFQDSGREGDSENYTVEELSQQEEHEQDEEPEEDTLYIDDVRYIELQEENMQDNVNLPEVSENSGKLRNAGNTLEEVKQIIQQADFVIKQTESSINSMSREGSVGIQSTNEQDCVRDNLNNQIAFIHGKFIEVPSEQQVIPQNTTDIEFVDSTNTALTLLELAGGSYRNTVDVVGGMKVEAVALDQDVTLVSEQSQEKQFTNLTTLQPVPIEAPARSVETAAVSQSRSEPNTIKTVSPPQPQARSRMSNDDAQSQIERLKEGDFPKMCASKRTYRGLSSPIVSQKEIADEIIERTKSKIPYSEPKDIFFTMKIAHRLANRIVPAEKGGSDNASGDTDIPDQPSGKDESSFSTPASRKESFAHPEEKSFTSSQQKSAISDKYELLKILEDDPDDPDEIPDLDESKLLNKIINKHSKLPSKTKSKFSPLLKLHPELEKELALKQLEDFGYNRKKRSLGNDKEMIRKLSEHNNNTSGKRRVVESFVKTKRLKTVVKDQPAVTVDPSQVTETLAVEGQDVVPDQAKDKSLKQYSNKRLSRNSETPPRDIPMEILLNGVEDDVDLVEDGKAKNKIFKATNPRKRREELKKKKQTHFANVLQRNKPHKKRGRPPKKKLPTFNDTFNDDLIILPGKRKKLKNADDKEEPENLVSKENESPKDEKLQRVKKLTEIEKLLGDEGAINMLYSVEQKRAVGSELKRDVLPSYRRKKKDLMLKTKLVKSAVLRLSSSPSLTEGKISLRERTTKEENEGIQVESALRKMSVDSHESHHSANSGNAEVFPFPAKIVPAEASRIIRRHSSSSNYSSRSNSPRRLSVDGGEQPSVLSPGVPELGQGDAPLPGAHKHKHPRTPQQNEVASAKRLTKDLKLAQSPRGTDKTPTAPTPSTTVDKTIPKEQIKTSLGKPRGRPRKILLTEATVKKSSELDTTLSAAVNDFTKAIEKIDSNISTPKKAGSPSNLRIGSPTKVMNKVYTRGAEGPGKGKPKGSVVYRELTLQRHGRLVEITLAPVSTRLKNSLNATVLREITSVLVGLTKDDNCRAVLLTSTGSVFCQGIDFFSLLHDTPEKRKTVAIETAVAVKDFIKALAMFSKPVVAGVQGATVGLGVTLLPLCDLVYCSQNATFHTPYARLGQVPEGAASLTLPLVLGNSATSELLFSCRKLTSAEALAFGLVTRVLDSDNFHDQVLPIVSAMASQSSQAMDATKALLRHNLLSGLETTLISETHLLIQHWVSEECQQNFALYLQDDEQTLALQKQPT